MFFKLSNLRLLHERRYVHFQAARYRFYTWVAAIAFLLLALVGIASLGQTRARHYRHHQEVQSQMSALKYLGQGDNHNAFFFAQRTLNYNPENVLACRIMAELADQTHSPSTLDWLQRLVQNEPTMANKLILASAALNYQKTPFPLTVQLLNDLESIAPQSANYQVVAAKLALNNHDLPAAQAYFELASKLEPDNQLFRLSVATLQIYLTKVIEKSQARDLVEAMRADGNLGLLALRALVGEQLFHHDLSQAGKYSEELVSNQKAGLEDQLQNLDILHQLNSDGFTSHLLVVQKRAAANAITAAKVASWMQANGLLAESLDWLTDLPIELLLQQPVQSALAQGYLQNGNWLALRKITAQGNWQELEYLRFAMQYRAYSKLGAAGLSSSSWATALMQAGPHREAMMRLLELTKIWQARQAQEELLLQLVQEYPQETWVPQELERACIDGGNTMELHQLYHVLSSRFPQDITYKNNLAATSLLLKIDLKETCQLAKENYTAAPGNPAVVSTYAFALHLQGWDKQGVALLKKLPPQDLNQPSVALYNGVLLAAIGRHDLAKPWLKIAESHGQLLPEEKNLLADDLAYQ